MKYNVGDRVRVTDPDQQARIDKQGAVTGRFGHVGTVVDSRNYVRMPDFEPGPWPLGEHVLVHLDGMFDDEAWECRVEEVEPES